MSRNMCVAVLGCLFAACMQPAYGQHNQLINESVRLYGQGRFVQAIETAERALKSAEEAAGPEHPDVATALNNLAEFGQVAALVSKDQAAYLKAIEIAAPLHKRALAIREKALGLRHSLTLASMVNLARVYGQQRQFDEAEESYKRALGILDAMGPRDAVLVDLARQATTGLSGIEKARKQNAPSAQPVAATEKQYANPDHRWSISYPADWKLDDQDRVFVKLSRGPAILGIHTFTDVAGKTLDEFADASLQRWERNMRSVNVFTQVSRQRVTLAGGLPAIEVVHHIGRGAVGKSRKLIAMVKDRGFWIDAEMGLDSWADHARDFNRIAESFRVQD